MSFNPSSRARLTEYNLPLFQGPTFFDRIARVLCSTNCVPRKELLESWEFAKRVRRRLRGGRVVDLACGHGLIAHFLLLLDDTTSTALAVDRRIPKSAAKISEALVAAWPRLEGRVQFVEQKLSEVEVLPGDLVVSAHACGGLTDEVLDKAISVSARVVVMPCCQATGKNDSGGLEGWLAPDFAIDVTRAARLRAHGYSVHTVQIPETITAKNRLLFGEPPQ